MSAGVRDLRKLDHDAVIPVFDPLRRVNAALLELLDSFRDDDWKCPTVHPGRDAKDLMAHLLHGSLRRVTGLRDAYHRPRPQLSSNEELVDFIQADNRNFIAGARRLSPRILRELIERYDPVVVELFEAMEPHAPGLGVAWAGEAGSPNWFDVAREYTEKWHHQQQLRDATGRPALYEESLLRPALETFARGLPFAYRGFDMPRGACISVRTTGDLDCAWTLSHAIRTAGACSRALRRTQPAHIALPAETGVAGLDEELHAPGCARARRGRRRARSGRAAARFRRDHGLSRKAGVAPSAQSPNTSSTSLPRT